MNFRKGRVYAGQRANLLAVANSERKINYIKRLLENQTTNPKHRWTKVRPDPRFPDDNLDTVIFALGASRPLTTKRPGFVTSLLSAWSVPMMQGYQQMIYNHRPGLSQRDTFLSDLINSRIGCPYPSMGSHFGK